MIQGKVAVVTGSTSGIGLGVAQALARAGASVVLNGVGDRRVIEMLRAKMAEERKVPVEYSTASRPVAIPNHA